MRKLLANENFPFGSIRYLQNKGFDLIAIGIDNHGILDSEIMALAIKEERTIITFDKDYGELIFRHNYKPEMGVIFLRLDEYDLEEPGYIVESILNNSEIELVRTFTVVDNDGIRQRKY